VWGVPWGINQIVRQSLLDGLANHPGGLRGLYLTGTQFSASGSTKLLVTQRPHPGNRLD